MMNAYNIQRVPHPMSSERSDASIGWDSTNQMPTASQSKTDLYWNAVSDRRSDLDGVFYFAVRTTHIYCRPSCPARRPKRENVQFFFAPDAAEKAGFRACKRCRPRQVGEPTGAPEITRRACAHIEQNLDATVTQEALAAALDCSPFQLQRAFRTVLGITPHEYLESRRIAVFKTALRYGHSVADATYEAGFNSSSRIYERAATHLGMTPRQYRKGAPDTHIAYSISPSPLGRLLVAATEKGVCKIAFGDSDASLVNELSGEFRNAQLTQDSGALSSAVQQVVGLISGERRRFDLPTDVRATAFQVRVWQELQRIPRGQTRSYQEVAARIGRPEASRAVARACASNRLAIAIPCHRVVRKSGDLGGYRWGIARKKKLLAAEK